MKKPTKKTSKKSATKKKAAKTSTSSNAASNKTSVLHNNSKEKMRNVKAKINSILAEDFNVQKFQKFNSQFNPSISKEKESPFGFKKIIVAVSGGFDPVHIGHIRMFNDAKKLGDHLVVIVNNDNWLMKKKGFVFMPENERKEIIESLKTVDSVLLTSHSKNDADMSVCVELEKLKPDIFANGGDRKAGNIPEYSLCERLNIEMVFDVGAGGKIQSSSDLVKAATKLSP